MNIATLTDLNDSNGKTVKIFMDILEERPKKRDLFGILNWLENPNKWRYPRVSIETFIDSPHFLGLGDKVFPEVRRMAREIINGKYMEAIVVAGIGSGKSFLSQILACYMAYTLLCMRNPFQYYRLVSDKPLTIMNMGPTATQAENVVFDGIKNLIQSSPFFLQHRPHILGGSIYFSDNRVLLMPGNSKSTTPLGYNLFFGILDEAAFYLDNDDKDVAEDIYTSLQRRIVSRFGYDGGLVGISSPRYVDDFIMRKLKDGEKFKERIYTQTAPTWKCVPIEKQDTVNKFYFNCRKGYIEETIPTDFGVVNKIQDPFDETAEIWEIPGEYKVSFQQNPEKAKRDYGAVPSLTLQGFFPLPHVVAACFDETREVPYDRDNVLNMPPALRTSYFIHLDLAINKGGKGDFAGLCMAHFDDWNITENGERQKKVYVDLLMRIGAGPLGKIDFEDIRQIIYQLKNMGYSIKKCTMDGFQSEDMMQILTKKSIRAEYLSLDRNIEPYNTFKEVVYTGRLNCHPMPKAKEEMSRLEVIKGVKVDHPAGGSKDVADALCGAVYNVITDGGASVGVAGTSTWGQPKSEVSLDGQKSERRKHMDMLIALKNKGLL